MNKSLYLKKKILQGENKIESSWYKNKVRPLDRINKGDIKNYCIFVFLKKIKSITPFKISNTGFGTQSA